MEDGLRARYPDQMARLAAERGDDGTNDLLVSDVIRGNELQVWFVAEHVVDVTLAQAV